MTSNRYFGSASEVVADGVISDKAAFVPASIDDSEASLNEHGYCHLGDQVNLAGAAARMEIEGHVGRSVAAYLL